MWALTKLRRLTSLNCLKIIYYSFAYTYLSYCISSWGGAPQTSLKPLAIKQRKLVRIMLFQSYTSPTDTLFHDLEFLNMDQIYIFNIGKLMHKHHKNKNILVSHNLKPVSNIHNYNTRSTSRSNYFLPSARTRYAQVSLSVVGPKVWNSISVSIKSLPALYFNKFFKHHLLNKLD